MRVRLVALAAGAMLLATACSSGGGPAGEAIDDASAQVRRLLP